MSIFGRRTNDTQVRNPQAFNTGNGLGDKIKGVKEAFVSFLTNSDDPPNVRERKRLQLLGLYQNLSVLSEREIAAQEQKVELHCKKCEDLVKSYDQLSSSMAFLKERRLIALFHMNTSLQSLKRRLVALDAAHTLNSTCIMKLEEFAAVPTSGVQQTRRNVEMLTNLSGLTQKDVDAINITSSSVDGMQIDGAANTNTEGVAGLEEFLNQFRGSISTPEPTLTDRINAMEKKLKN